MKCPTCNGELVHVSEVSGSFVSDVVGNEVIYEDQEFYGDSNNFIECKDCKSSFNYDFIDTETNKIKLIEEE